MTTIDYSRLHLSSIKNYYFNRLTQRIQEPRVTNLSFILGDRVYVCSEMCPVAGFGATGTVAQLVGNSHPVWNSVQMYPVIVAMDTHILDLVLFKADELDFINPRRGSTRRRRTT